MSSYEVRAQRFIQAFYPYLTDCSDVDEYCEASYNFMIDHPKRKVAFDHGLTRVAFITSDYVVKIDYDEEAIACYGGSEKEVKFYSLAEREGMAHLFAKISRYIYRDRTFYIMPRITGIDEDRWEDASYFMTDEENDWCDNHNLCDLHCKNYGIVNGHVKIIDYGCYDE